MLKDYRKGKRWGFAIFRKNVELYGKVGVVKSDKASMTCDKIVKSKKRKGKNLTKSQLDFYKGAVSGFLEFYNKKITGFERPKNVSRITDDFDYTDTGRIKGSYIDGRFEPD